MSGQYKIKSLLCAAAFVLLAVAAVLVVKYWHHTLPAEECGEVYCRYSNRDDLKVSFLKDFRINDSTTVDVTTITAKDSAGWEALQREMNRSESLIELERKYTNEGHYSISFYNCEIGHPEHSIPFKEGKCWMVFLNNKEKTIYIFHILNRKQKLALIRNKAKEVKENAKKY